jgi:hypothetical protein
MNAQHTAEVARLFDFDSAEFPEPNIVVSGSRELELMEAQRLQEGRFVG